MKKGIIKKVIPAIVLFSVSASQVGFGQQVSDQALKKNIAPLENALAFVQQLEPKKFEYNTERYHQLNLPAGRQYGFLAEEVQKVLPDLVRTQSHPYMVAKNTYRNATLKDTDLESLIPLLVAAIKEQQEQIEELKRQLETQQPK